LRHGAQEKPVIWTCYGQKRRSSGYVANRKIAHATDELSLAGRLTGFEALDTKKASGSNGPGKPKHQAERGPTENVRGKMHADVHS